MRWNTAPLRDRRSCSTRLAGSQKISISQATVGTVKDVEHALGTCALVVRALNFGICSDKDCTDGDLWRPSCDRKTNEVQNPTFTFSSTNGRFLLQ